MPHLPTLTSTLINTISRVALCQRLLHNTDMIDNDNVTSSQIPPFGYSIRISRVVIAIITHYIVAYVNMQMSGFVNST